MKERAKVVVRKLRQEATQLGWRRSKSIRWTIGIGLTLAIAALFPRAHNTALSGYSVGSLWTNEDVSAPFSYPIYKDDFRYAQDVHKALDALFPVYTPDTSAATQSLRAFHRSWGHLEALLTLALHDSIDQGATDQLLDSAKQLGLSRDGWTALTSFVRAPKSGREAVREGSTGLKQLDEAESQVARVLSALATNAMITQGTAEEAAASNAPFFSLRVHPQEETILSRDSLITIEAAENRIFTELDQQHSFETSVTHAIAHFAASALQPSVHYSPRLTEESRYAIQERVPRTDGIVVEGQKIVSKGQVITPAIRQTLESLSRSRMDRGGWLSAAGRIAGTIGHAAIIVLLIVLYLKFIRRKIYNDNAQLLLMALMLLFPAILAYLSVRIQVDFPLEYFILIPVTAMLLTILFDSRTGFYGTVVAALIVAGIRGNDYTIALAALCAGAFAAYTVRDLRNRAQLFTSIGYIFIGYLVAIIALSLEQGTPWGEVALELIAALGNALISPVLTLGVLFVVESIFDTVSDLRLTEFDNINHPLLRELALRAPGTYQHTMLVAQLAENASIAIGANALLSKVGAYFHDVGKLTEPLDFVENQNTEAGNVHESLTPLQSAQRVKSHVEQGIDLARAHSLPERVIDFIPMHHGTLPISFFYQKALANATPDEPVRLEDFTYPGPRPNTKETAILMLADASEAIARSLAARPEDLTTEAIDEAIDQLIHRRFEEAQLDLCDLTFKDLVVIRSVFTRLLSGLHHARIQYPTTSELAEEAASSLASHSNPALA